MNETKSKFQPRGVMSARDACLQVFQAMEPGHWISEDDLVHQARELTEFAGLGEDTILTSSWQAREDLAAAHEVGVERYMGGFKRLTPDGQVKAAVKRLGRTKRAVKRTVRWANAALANPEISGAERHQMQQITSVQLRQAQLEERRASKHRPQ